MGIIGVFESKLVFVILGFSIVYIWGVILGGCD